MSEKKVIVAEVIDADFQNSHHHGHSGTERNLESRHLMMIAIGGTIGTGLFVKSGSTLAAAGALNGLLAYIFAGIGVFFVVSSLGEMATLIPISGSFNTYASRYVDEALGFTAGWNYWFQWVITLPIEIQAAAGFISYWAPDFDQYIIMAIILVCIVAINCVAVSGFGEVEYWLSLIKIIAIVFFIFVGFALVFQGKGGFYNYYATVESAKPLLLTNDVGGPFLGASFTLALRRFVTALSGAAFAFGGTELVGITAGEAKNPRKSVPRAISGTFWRIMIFYVITIFLIGLLLPVTLEQFQSKVDLERSPFVIALSAAKIANVDHFMNFIGMIAVLSAGNSSVYASSRSLMALAQEGRAPRWCAWTTEKHGVPLPAVLISVLIGCLSFMGTFFGDTYVFNWLINIIGLAICFTWLFIVLTHIRFRKAYLAQGFKLEDLPYQALFFPYGAYYAIFICLTMIIGVPIFRAIGEDGVFDGLSLLSNAITIPVYIVLFVFWKFFKGTKLVELTEMDLKSGNINLNGRVDDFVEPERKGIKKLIHFLA